MVVMVLFGFALERIVLRPLLIARQIRVELVTTVRLLRSLAKSLASSRQVVLPSMKTVCCSSINSSAFRNIRSTLSSLVTC